MARQQPHRTDDVKNAPWVWVTVVFLGSCLFHLLTYGVRDDHFDRISRARQIVQYGELPFKDFFDPGWFLTLFSSAAVQATFGDNLLGEAVLNVVAFSAGFTLTFVLLLRITRSLPLAVLITGLSVAVGPRFYDYDKVFFYPLGAFLCWRYSERTSISNLVLLAVGTAIAFWFRYDNGLYIACAGVVLLLAIHGMSAAFVRRIGAYVMVAVLVSLPCLLFLQVSGGVTEYARQLINYAAREGNRTSLFHLPDLKIDNSAPLFAVKSRSGYPVKVRWTDGLGTAERVALEERFTLADPALDGGRTWWYRLEDNSVENVRRLIDDGHIEDTAFIDRNTAEVMSSEPLVAKLRRFVPVLRLQILPGVFSRANATAILCYLFLVIPILAVLVICWNSCRRWSPSARQREAARGFSLVTLCVLIDVFILREPFAARIGAVAPPLVILGTWVVGQLALEPVNPTRVSEASLGWSVAHVLLVAFVGLGTLAVWSDKLSTMGVTPVPWREKLQRLAASPPSLALLPSGRLSGLVRYARECTGSGDRLMVTWFVPQLFTFASRGFAGGMVSFFGGHWSDTAFQRRVVSRLEEQSVPLVFIEKNTYGDFRRDFTLVDDYLRTNYQVAGESSFGDPYAAEDSYRVLSRNGVPSHRTYESWQLPCFP